MTPASSLNVFPSMERITKSPDTIVPLCHFTTIRDDGSATGSDRNRIESMKLKIAVLAPIPNASDSAARAVNRRFLAMPRSP